MAENKKTIVVYADWIHQFEPLTDEEAGKLIKHFFRYINDKSPVSDRMIELLFTPIKHQLKRDLIKWETILEGRSKAGKASAEARKFAKQQELTNSTNVESVKEIPTNSTDNVNDNVNVILLEKETKYNISERKQIFYNSLIPFLAFYEKEMLKDFYEYWTEHGEKDKKFRMEKEKTFGLERRLKTWATNNFKNKQNGKITTTDEFKQLAYSIRGNNPNL